MNTPLKPAGGPPAEATGLFATPHRSVLKTAGPPRRIVDHTAAHGDDVRCVLSRGLDHLHMFQRVQEVEAERDALKEQVRKYQEVALQLESQQQQRNSDAERCVTTGETVEELKARLQQLQQELLHEQQERRKAHNALVDLRGNIRVYCRVRPASSAQPSAVHTHINKQSVTVSASSRDHTFNFNHVFSPDASQAAVFTEVSDLVQSCLDGYDVCILSYGQTGSGKTHTMMGNTADARSHGLVPRALTKLLEARSRLRLQDWTYTIQLSIIEIYNDRLRDLLDPGGKEISEMHAIRHDPAGLVSIAGVSQHDVEGCDQAIQLITRAASNRSSHATAMNASSSRSHSVMMLSVKGHHKPSNTTTNGSLFLVDLAGSERLERSLADGPRKVEACAINLSLSTLVDVFEALSAKAAHVPYRNSKLAYLLKPCLSPGGKTLMMVHVSPEPASAYESLTSLRLATKVAGVEVGPAHRRMQDSAVLAEWNGQSQRDPTVRPAASGSTSSAFSTRRAKGTGADGAGTSAPKAAPRAADLASVSFHHRDTCGEDDGSADDFDLRAHLKRKKLQLENGGRGQEDAKRAKKVWH